MESYCFILFTGPLTSTDSVSLIAFLNGPNHSEEDLPDFQLYFAETPTKAVKKKYGLTDEVNKYWNLFDIIIYQGFCAYT